MKFNEQLIQEVREGKAAIETKMDNDFSMLDILLKRVCPYDSIPASNSLMLKYYFVRAGKYWAYNETIPADMKAIPLHDFILEEKEEDVDIMKLAGNFASSISNLKGTHWAGLKAGFIAGYKAGKQSNQWQTFFQIKKIDKKYITSF